MIIKTKFKLRDKVYSIKRSNFFKKNQCGRCDGEGTIEFRRHIEISCPTCKGWGFDGLWNKGDWKASSNYDVIWIIKGERGIGYLRNKVTYILASEVPKVKAEWKEEDLFHTFKEAENECDRRNNE